MPHKSRPRFHLPDPAGELKWFFKEMKESDMLYVGIDPGTTGAIAFVSTMRKLDPFIVDIPTFKSQVMTTRKGKKMPGIRTVYNHAAIVMLLDPLIDHRERVVIALERAQPHPADTAKTAFSVGCGYSMWHLYFAAFAMQVEEMQPSVWKRRMGLLGQEKDASRSKAMKLFPGSCHYFACAGDHNRAEAALLAEAMHREHQGINNADQNKKRHGG